MKELSILILDDEEIIRTELRDFLSQYDFNIYLAGLPSEGFAILENNFIDVLLLDLKMPEMDGFAVLEKVKKKYPQVEIIMITGHGDVDSAVKSMKLGAFDFFNKPLNGLEIKQAIQRTSRFIDLSNKLKDIEQKYTLISQHEHKEIGNIIAQSGVMKECIAVAQKAAALKDTSVLITGPSGSGKELIARVIHYGSTRKEHLFYALNCSAIPDSLVESEFFGHRKGAYTGATENRAGIFEAANKGTLFLDEIADMSLTAQAKILRVLEEGAVKRIGDHTNQQVDIRIVSATNKDIHNLVKNEEFRTDLYYRLNTIEIHIPPLCERRDDIPPLVHYYTNHYCKKLGKRPLTIHKDVFNLLDTYHFPGNVRELKNIVERALILCDSPELREEHFSFLQTSSPTTAGQKGILPTLDLEILEKMAITEGLKQSGYNKTQAAKFLGISVYALLRKMKKFDITVRKEI